MLWGQSTPHFSPWDLIKLLSNIHANLEENGIFIYDETDRQYTVFVRTGYKDIFLEQVDKNKLIISTHRYKNHATGYFHRIVYDIIGNKSEEMKIDFWDIAGSAALTWIFFEDIGYIPVNKDYSGILIARNPRRSIEPARYIESQPTILSKHIHRE